MPDFVCNKQKDDKGRHEVHVVTCSHRPSIINSLEMGWYRDCSAAIKDMEKQNPYHEFDGCYYCCYPCHKG